MSIPISLKWGKISYDDQLSIQPGAPADRLKSQVHALTSVPIHRQKLLCPKAWKGALKDAIPGAVALPKGKRSLVVTLIGSADVLAETPPGERPRFSEDMTPQQLWEATRTPGGVDRQDVFDIVALQKEPGMDRDDGKMETYAYDRLVTGLPQQQIEDALARGKEHGGRRTLEGKAAMTMGAELRRAYVNSLAVLPNGTLASGLDDGHVQLWRRGRLFRDVRHAAATVDHVRAFPPAPAAAAARGGGPAFATAGDGALCLWTEEGDRLVQIGTPPDTSPADVAIGSLGASQTTYLAACLRATRQTDPHRFRLLPQNEAERRRREAAEAHEELTQRELSRLSRCVAGKGAILSSPCRR